MTADNLLERVRDEADVCRNDGAFDRAALLDEVVALLEELERRLGREGKPSEPV
jgi:hypothetical protein